MANRSLAVFPAYRDNPFLNLMLLAPRARGWNVVESMRLEQLEQHLSRIGAGDVFHMHWTAPIVQRADSLETARARLDRYRGAVDAARARGARLVWTVHNVLPHDARHGALERVLDQYLADTADAIHVMNMATISATAEHYTLPEERVTYIPHPSYQGVYPASMTRADARRSLGVDEDERAVLFFGQMRPYKGLDVLIEATARIPAARRPVLLLAGRTTDDDRAALSRLIPDDFRTVRAHGFIPDDEVQLWFRAADRAVFPFQRVLNSGSMHLAASFGIPVIAPGNPNLRNEFIDEPWIDWFDTEHPAQSLAALLDASHVQPDTTRQAAESFSRRRAPFAISRRYADLLDHTVSGARRTAVSAAAARSV